MSEKKNTIYEKLEEAQIINAEFQCIYSKTSVGILNLKSLIKK